MKKMKSIFYVLIVGLLLFMCVNINSANLKNVNVEMLPLPFSLDLGLIIQE